MLTDHAPDRSWEQVREFAYSFVHVGAVERVEVIPLESGDKRVCAQNVTALTNLPFADSSSMDGWAVNGDGPWTLINAQQLEENQACVVTTGSALPFGTQGIVRTEHGTVAGDQLSSNNASTGDIRKGGEECSIGQTLCAPGVTLNPALIGLLAATGHDQIKVFTQPRVQLIITGDELLTSGLPTRDRVRDSLGIQVPMWLNRMGAHSLPVLHLNDSPDEISDSLISSQADIVLTTGGTASSAKDHFVTAISMAAGEVLLDGVSVRPGHPMKFAVVQNSEGKQVPIVGLPGNPLAAIIALSTLVQPMVNKLLGQPLQPLIPATTSQPLTSGKSGTKLSPGWVTKSEFTPAKFNGSAMLRGLSTSTGFAIIPTAIDEGDTVNFLPLPT